MKKERDSNIELLRIICILFIIGDHFTGQSGIVEGGSLFTAFFYCGITSLSRVACSVYIIISAWFSVNSKFKFQKISHIWLTVIMYTVPITVYLMLIGVVTRDNMMVAFFPIEESPLWFAGYYIILFFLSPFLKFILNKAKKELVEFFLAIMFIFLVLYPSLTARLGFFSNDIWILIFLYMLTGYIKKYININMARYKYIVIFGSIWLLITCLRAFSQRYAAVNPFLMGEIGKYSEFYRARLQTVPNLVMAYSIFFFFSKLKIKKSVLINSIAASTLGVYVYHQVPNWYMYMWNNLYHADYYASVLSGTKRMVYTLICIFSVWIIGTIIEMLRNRLSYYLIESRNYYINICERINEFVNNNEDAQHNYNYNVLYKKIVILISVYILIVMAYSRGYLNAFINIRKLSSNMKLNSEQIEFVLDEQLRYDNGNIYGTVYITNNGDDIVNLSGGTYPVMLGISIVDSNCDLVNLDYLHVSIENGGAFKNLETVPVQINMNDMEQIINQGYGIRFEIVQEGVSWYPETVIYYWG